MTVEKSPYKFYHRSYWQLSNLVCKICYGQAILSGDFDVPAIDNLRYIV